MVPQHTPEVELTALGNIADAVPTASDGGCTDMLRRVEDRSRTDGFVAAVAADELVDEANCNAGCDL